MFITALILSSILLMPTQDPVSKVQDAPAAKVLSPAELEKLSPADRTRYERARTIAKRNVDRQNKAKAQTARRARAAKDEAKLLEYELKMAPIIAARQAEMANIRAQQEQIAINRQAVINAQQYQAARIAQENDRIAIDYWKSQQPIKVIIPK
jgi:hypothetical protein